jgi:hypothetical protein
MLLLLSVERTGCYPEARLARCPLPPPIIPLDLVRATLMRYLFFSKLRSPGEAAQRHVGCSLTDALADILLDLTADRFEQ